MAGDIVSEVLEGVGGLLLDLVDSVVGPIDARLDANDTRLFSVLGNLLNPVDAVVDRVETLLSGLHDKVTETVDAVLSRTVFSLDDLRRQVIAFPDSILDGVGEFIGALNDDIRGFVDVSLDAVTSQISVTLTRAGDLAQIALEGVTAAVSAIGEGFSAAGEFVADKVAGSVFSFLPKLFEFLAPDGWERAKGAIEAFEDTPDLPPEIKALTAPGSPGVLGAAALITAFVALPAASSAVSSALSPWMQKVTQHQNVAARPSLLAPGDALVAIRRAFISEDVGRSNLEKAGYANERIDTLQLLDTKQLAISELISAWHRGLIEEEGFQIELSQLGFADKERAIIAELAFPIPGIQDLITMAVREVFSPEIAKKFGQFEEIPEAFIDWANKQGLSTFWATNFWAAHWNLPSIQQGFEMVHRGVIDQETLGQLFVALDVMPFWRDALSEISFRPYTRVDVRRMHAAGVLTDAQVLRAYLDQGYNMERATALQQFTIDLTLKAQTPATEKERDLTKTDVLGMFREGLLTEQDATTFLTQMGFDIDETDALISRENLRILREQRQAQKQLVFDKFRVGTLSFDAAQDAFALLDLTSVELARALATLVVERETAGRLPTKTDLDKFFKQGLTDIETYSEGLRLLGFAEHWITLYVNLIEAGVASDAGDNDT